MSDVVDMNTWKRKKNDEFAREGRTPLYVSHLTGKISGTPPDQRKPEPVPDFGDRLHRIRMSLEKINRLMIELNRMGDEHRNTPEP